MVEIPDAVMAALVREQALLSGTVDYFPSQVADGVPLEITVWDALKECTFTHVECIDNDVPLVRVEYTHHTTVSTKERRASRWQPAEYANHDVEIRLSAVWSLDPETAVELYGEVVDSDLY